MLSIFNSLLNTNQREINRLVSIVEKINSLEKNCQKLTDKQLSNSFTKFSQLYQDGQSLDSLLPEVYATVREVMVRKLKARLFDVQLMAAIALYGGKVAEQKTGEGKTFSCVPALFLKALTQKGAHLVTVNDYLSRLGCGWVGPVYHSLGASVSVIIHEEAFTYDPEYRDPSKYDERLMHLKPISRKDAYNTNITYGTNNEFGFDYLRDNMVHSLKDQVQRGHYYAVVDEVDSILIDEARTPLIISAPAQEPTKKYYEFAAIIDKLSADTDYVIDEKQRSANLTEHGVLKIEKILGVENLYEKDFSSLHHIEQSLKARTLFLRDRDYIVKDGEVIIVDEFTGRLMPGRRYSEGLHQAIEAKENVPIQQESQTLATISFQNYFRMYEKLAGMTGTAATEAEELHKIYKLDVVMVPTNQPMIRVDHPDLIYKTQKAKYTAVANEVARLNQIGQPVLVGTTAIDKNELLSELLKRKGISHALLNAKNHEKEAEIITKAGEKGAVTVATNMAGRGVDIKLGEGVVKLGGLAILGTERHESRRIDNQLRGRSGRQGDPGFSRFFVSLEDDLMRIFGGEQVSKIMDFLKMPEDTPIEHGMVSKAIESAQIKVEGHNFDIRKTTVEYDDVMNQQRQIIYGVRKKVLEAADPDQTKTRLRDDILAKVEDEVKSIVTIHTSEGFNHQKIIDDFSTIINFDPNSLKAIHQQISQMDNPEEISQFLIKIAHDIYTQREKDFGEEVVSQMENFVFLTTIDSLWVEHLDSMDDLRAGIGLRGFAQRDPLIEYKKEAFEMFEKLIKTIDSTIVHQIFKISTQQGPLRPQTMEAVERHPEIETGVETEIVEEIEVARGRPISKIISKEGAATKVTVERPGQNLSQETKDSRGSLVQKKPGRNDPCYCGSGKKYKRCHYPN